MRISIGKTLHLYLSVSLFVCLYCPNCLWGE